MAFYRKLPEELQEMNAHVLTKLLEIHINSINSSSNSCIHQLWNQILSGTCSGQYLISTDVLRKIVHKSPYLQPFFMGKRYIISCSIVDNITIVVSYIEPGWWNYIHSGHVLNSLWKSCIGICGHYLMPYQIHRLVHGKISIRFPNCFSVHIQILNITYTALLYISDITIPCGYLIPVLQFFHKDQIISFVYPGQYFWFDSSTVAHICILSCCDYWYAWKILLNRYTVWLLVHISIQICISLYKIKAQISGSVLQPYITARLSGSRCINQLRRSSVQNLLTFFIPVISLVQITIHHIYRKIWLFARHNCLLLQNLGTYYNYGFWIVCLSIIFSQIHLFPGRNAAHDQGCNNSDQGNCCDQHAHHYYRINSSLHKMFILSVNV